jgi:hypothetical protein
LKSIRYFKKNESYFVKLIKQQICKKRGYLRYYINNNGIKKTCRIHVLVAKAFIPNPLNLPEVNHIGILPNGMEGNKLDNRAVSLCWSTAIDNVRHAYKNELNKGLKGEENGASKLTDSDVVDIRTFLSQGMKITHIAKKFKIDRKVIYLIKDNKLWTHVK